IQKKEITRSIFAEIITLSVIRCKLTSGASDLFSINRKSNNEIEPKNKNTGINKFRVAVVCEYERTKRNEVTVTASVTLPFMSIEGTLPSNILLALLSKLSKRLFDFGNETSSTEGCRSCITLLITNHNPTATNTIEKNVARQPKFSIMVDPI